MLPKVLIIQPFIHFVKLNQILFFFFNVVQKFPNLVILLCSNENLSK